MIENQVYGGAYAYGKTRAAPGFGSTANRSGIRRKAREEWLVLIPDAHEGYVSWERAEAIRKMVSDNVPSSRHHGAPKHDDALLAGLVRCRRCGRKLTVRYTAQSTTFRVIPAGGVCSTMANRAVSPLADCVLTTRLRKHCYVSLSRCDRCGR
ncbi:recombinase family protein [Roseibium sp. M-1]